MGKKATVRLKVDTTVDRELDRRSKKSIAYQVACNDHLQLTWEVYEDPQRQTSNTVIL